MLITFYTGSSCEQCKSGYYRAPGLYLGLCKKCDCNGHSSTCKKDGTCIVRSPLFNTPQNSVSFQGCRDNRAGPKCNQCRNGYDQLPSGECVRKPKVPCKSDDVKKMCSEKPLDLVFLIDGSDSIVISDFEKVKEWITELITLLDSAELEQSTNVVVTQFSTMAETELTSTVDDKSVVQRINDIEQMAKGTNLYAGLSHINHGVAARSDLKYFGD